MLRFTRDIDLLIRPADIDRAVVDVSRSGAVRIARKEDIIWLKRFGNSDQDQVEIKRLSDDEN